MVSLVETTLENEVIAWLYVGLSTDEKPTEDNAWEARIGSRYFAYDTLDYWIYVELGDAENTSSRVWRLLTKGDPNAELRTLLTTNNALLARLLAATEVRLREDDLIDQYEELVADTERDLTDGTD